MASSSKTAPMTAAGDPIPGAIEGMGDTPDGATEARVLIAFDVYQPNDIFDDGTADEIEQLRLAGLVDPHPSAVAYAKSLIG